MIYKFLVIIVLASFQCAEAAQRFVSLNQIQTALADVDKHNGLDKKGWPKAILIQESPRQWKLEYPEFTLWFDCERKMPWKYEYTLLKDPGVGYGNDAEQMFYWEKRVLADCQMNPLEINPSIKPWNNKLSMGFAVSAMHFDHHYRSIFAVQTLTNRILIHTAAKNGAIRRTEEIAECRRAQSPITVLGGAIWEGSDKNSSQAQVPDAFWKVIFSSTPTPTISAWLIQNNELASTERLDAFSISIEALEAKLGYALPVPKAPKSHVGLVSPESDCKTFNKIASNTAKVLLN